MNHALRRAPWLLALACACLPELEQFEGEHIFVEHSAEYQLCRGSVDYLDDLIPHLSAEMGQPMPPMVRYSWLNDDDRERLMGPKRHPAEGGLTIVHHALSYGPPVLTHEIVHAIVGTMNTAPFFAEGTAVVYDSLIHGRRNYFAGGMTGTDPRPLMTLGAVELDYGLAGSFVHYLLVRHGPTKFFALYAGLDKPYTMTRIRAAFRRAYGLELDDEVARYLASDGTCDAEYFDLLSARCTAEVEPWTGDVWSFADVFSCDSPGMVGGRRRNYDGLMFRVTTLEVPESGDYDISFVTDGGLSVYLAPCFGCPWAADGEFLDHGTERRTLAAGRYHVRAETFADEPLRFSVTVRRAGPPDPE